MSWQIDLQADRPIQKADVEAVLATLPKELRGPVPELNLVANNDGWTCAVDVHLPVDATLCISGASFSAPKALSFAKHLHQGLAVYGYKMNDFEKAD